ncbi:MAG TPA: glycosyltransferase [Acidimicrobiales bacterium]|nr:glycosyltransferase [Acidimicrobiales bacterium]
MALLLDLQGAQSVDHRDRGVARYVRELALAYERRGPASPVAAYLLNPDLPLPGGVEPLVAGGKLRFVDDPGVYGSGDVLHLASPVELSIPIDRLVPPAARAAGVRVVCTVFDLIPRSMPDVYLEDPGLRRRYLARLELLRAADGLVAISNFVASDVVAQLGVAPARVAAVPLVASASFRPDPTIHRERVVLTTGGSDGRKNLEALVDAWSLVPAGVRRGWRLVVVGTLPPLFANHLRVRADDSLELRGFVTEDELVAWNQRAGLVVFPSRAEGFGLPVVEAQACGAPVIAGDNTAMVELLDPSARFDASSVDAMAAAITRALVEPPAASPPPARTWDDVADATAAFCADLPGRRTGGSAQNESGNGSGNGSGRRRLAFVSPLPPQPGGVATYSGRLLAALRARPDVAVDAYVDGPPHHRDAVLAADGARPLAAFDRVEALAGPYDDVVVALGNSEFHTGALALLGRRDGATVLAHDVRLTTLHRFAPWQHPEAAPGGFSATLHRMYDGLPAGLGAGGALSAEEAERWGVLMARDVIGRSRRFLTTSTFAAELARLDARPEHRGRIATVPFAAAPGVEPAPDRHPLVVSFGVLNHLKQASLLVEAFGAATPADAKARLAFVGPAGADDVDAVRRAAADAGLASDRVEVTGAVDDETYRRWLARAWVAVQLRASTNGESSAAVADCLAASLPTIVTGIGAARSLPAAAVVRVPPDVAAGARWPARPAPTPGRRRSRPPPRPSSPPFVERRRSPPPGQRTGRSPSGRRSDSRLSSASIVA